MKTIIVTAAEEIDGEAELVNQLFSSGLELLHLRKPNWTSEQVEKLILQIDQQYFSRIVVHGHYHLAVQHKLHGVHLKRRHRNGTPRNKLRRLLLKIRYRTMTFSSTFHSLQSLKEIDAPFDYIFLSSVFSKVAHFSEDESSGINLLQNVINGTSCEVYAYGGVNMERMTVVKAARFSGVVLSGVIWNEPSRDIQKETLSKFLQA